MYNLPIQASFFVDTKISNDGPASFKYGSSNLKTHLNEGIKVTLNWQEKGVNHCIQVYVCLEGELNFWENSSSEMFLFYGMKIKSYNILVNQTSHSVL